MATFQAPVFFSFSNAKGDFSVGITRQPHIRISCKFVTEKVPEQLSVRSIPKGLTSIFK